MTMTPPLRRLLVLALSTATSLGATAQGQPVAMSAAFGQAMCAAWNAEPTLTGKLVESGWMKNDVGRGFKTMQIYRADCPGAARIEMQIALKDGKAQCVYGGAAKTAKLDGTADYLMWAETSRWREMGAGEYGPMKAMMLGRLNFDGPNFEAMGNMGPFASFLRLVGKVPGDWGTCP
jgi:putative sterol carrier protein